MCVPDYIRLDFISMIMFNSEDLCSTRSYPTNFSYADRTPSDIFIMEWIISCWVSTWTYQM